MPLILQYVHSTCNCKVRCFLCVCGVHHTYAFLHSDTGNTIPLFFATTIVRVHRPSPSRVVLLHGHTYGQMCSTPLCTLTQRCLPTKQTPNTEPILASEHVNLSFSFAPCGNSTFRLQLRQHHCVFTCVDLIRMKLGCVLPTKDVLVLRVASPLGSETRCCIRFQWWALFATLGC